MLEDLDVLSFILTYLRYTAAEKDRETRRIPGRRGLQLAAALLYRYGFKRH
ncbi:hypothetical protein [Bacillus sp. MUM 13]|uniref:hypothetical protein n=1 Tax=Bacillus sp. MUM 13 TaxID=1678001 RepID=UPI00147A4D17|nr:hypothetical protein [Bacillus sp. MUM 13]